MAADLVSAPPPQARQVTPKQPPKRPVIPAGGCPSLTAALALARDRCKTAAKDGRNQHHNYAYATADEVIATASEALATSGLALIPQTGSLSVQGSGGYQFYGLDRTILLSHSSGEFVPLEVKGWPVIQDKGRPLDKAFAIALTSSLSYLLRDLLQMPRGTAEDMSARDDRQAAAPQEAASEEPVPNGPTVCGEQADRINKLIHQRGFAQAKIRARLFEKYGVDSVFLLTPEQADEIEQALQPKSQTQETPA